MAGDLAATDINDIFRHTQPSPGTQLADIENFERQHQLQLSAPYRSFLRIVNGWPVFYQDVDLCSLSDLEGGELVNRGWMLVEAADEGSGGMLGISRIAHLPIAVSVTGIDVFLLMLEEPEGAVSWVAGGEVERFPSFRQSLHPWWSTTGQPLKTSAPTHGLVFRSGKHMLADWSLRLGVKSG